MCKKTGLCNKTGGGGVDICEKFKEWWCIVQDGFSFSSSSTCTYQQFRKLHVTHQRPFLQQDCDSSWHT